MKLYPNRRGAILFLTLILVFLTSIHAHSQGSPNTVWRINPQNGSVDGVDFSNDGLFVATVAGDRARLWDAANGSLIEQFGNTFDNLITVDISPDNQFLAAGRITSGYPPGGLHNVWQISSGNEFYENGGAYVAYSENGQYLAAGGGAANRYLYVFTTNNGQRVMSVYTGNYVYDVAISPDGSTVAACGSDDNIKVYDVNNGNLIATLAGHSGDIISLDFSPDGNYFASAARNIKIWRASDWENVIDFDAYTNSTFGIDYSPDGNTLITCGRDGSLSTFSLRIKFFDVVDGSRLAMYDEPAYDVAFSSTGDYFVFGSPYGDIGVAHNPIQSTAVSIGMDPNYNPPIVQPGGSFGFTGTVVNNLSNPVSVDVWGGVRHYGNFYQQFMFSDVHLNAYQRLEAYMIQQVPTYAPIGAYDYIAYAGSQDNIIDSTSFEFEVRGPMIHGGGEDWFLKGDFDSHETPDKYILSENYPNPFNARTSINFELPDEGRVEFSVFNILGQKVETLIDENMQAGQYSVIWDASSYSSGIYFYTLNSDGRVLTRRMTLLK
ncbi:MAG: T9SS type A sorting domain-containing protein [candidate division Zixibacteria bacterium]|nr:T9SS type A sorting domain-containing protein [candidate division Zixibacteria bacterium]